jgi:hypothetical protein
MFFPSVEAAGMLRENQLPKIRALDESAYEGPEIVNDLTKPTPVKLDRIADFLLDGGTIDNVFDSGTTLRNAQSREIDR